MKTICKSLGREVRVRFELDVDDGFPPISSEVLLGVLGADELVRVDNTPFFIKGIAIDDIVKCLYDGKQMKYQGLVSKSGYKALSIILIETECKDELCNDLVEKNCFVEFGKFPEYEMLAIAIPPDMDYARILEILEPLEIYGKISVAELCIR